MRNKTIRLISSMFITLLAIVSCSKEQEPGTGSVDTEVTNQYVYGSDVYNIRSVVRYETETTVEFWMSSVAGLTSIGDIKNRGEYSVVAVSKSYLGTKDYFAKSGTYVRFNDLRFDNSHRGMGYIESSMKDGKIFLNFKVEKLYDGTGAVEKQLSGSYEGTYVDHYEVLNNQWSSNMMPSAVFGTHVDYITKVESGKWNAMVAVTLYGNGDMTHRAVTITIPEDKLGKEISDKDDVLSVIYDGDKVFNIANDSNIKKLIVDIKDNETISVSMSLASGGNFLAAEYEGNVNSFAEDKPNHISWTLYNPENPEEVEIVKATLQEMYVLNNSDGTISFRFGIRQTDKLTDENLPTLTFSNTLLDGEYHFALEENLGKFSYKGNYVTDNDPLLSEADIKGGTLYARKTDDVYKIIFRQQGRLVTGSQVADIEIFYYGVRTN